MDIDVEHLVVCWFMQRRYIKTVLIVTPAAALHSFFSFLILKRGSEREDRLAADHFVKHGCIMLCFLFSWVKVAPVSIWYSTLVS